MRAGLGSLEPDRARARKTKKNWIADSAELARVTEPVACGRASGREGDGFCLDDQASTTPCKPPGLRIKSSYERGRKTEIFGARPGASPQDQKRIGLWIARARAPADPKLAW